jgi:hypothetical protein
LGGDRVQGVFNIRRRSLGGSVIQPELMSVANSGVDLGLSPSGGGSSVWQLVLVVESVKQATVLPPPLVGAVLFPLVLLSDPPSRVQSSMNLSSSGLGLIHWQVVVLSSAGSDLVRSSVEDY